MTVCVGEDKIENSSPSGIRNVKCKILLDGRPVYRDSSGWVKVKPIRKNEQHKAQWNCTKYTGSPPSGVNRSLCVGNSSGICYIFHYTNSNGELIYLKKQHSWKPCSRVRVKSPYQSIARLANVTMVLKRLSKVGHNVMHIATNSSEVMYHKNNFLRIGDGNCFPAFSRVNIVENP